MRKLIFSLGVVILVEATAMAQFTYQMDQSVLVEINGQGLSMPWAGGLNSAQVNTMDLNNDGHQDLVVFDRTANKVITYLAEGQAYRYAPNYESLFPAEINQWFLLRDFNCDGKKDIFTSDPFGIMVFVNTTQSGNPLSWRLFNPGFPLLTVGFSGSVNLKVNQSDLPAIDDVDGDGDLDILNVRFVGVGTVEWHKNLSMERTGRCDSLQLQRITQTWGEFEECTCGKIAFTGEKTCAQLLSGGRTQHTGGKALLSLDFNNDGSRDLFFSEESCTNLYLLTNSGSSANSAMTSFSAFPSGSALSLPFFPAPYNEDVDFDGLRDLVVSPNLASRNSLFIDFSKSLLFYKNTGTAQQPQFTVRKNNFLQDLMIDVGDFSIPAFMDTDGDGDQDLFVANHIKANAATIYQFENNGTPTVPSFRLISEDFFGLSILNSYNMKIQFADMNADGTLDLVFSSTSKVNGATTIQYVANSANDKFLVTDAVVKQTNFAIAQNENWLVEDVDQDGLNDILVGNDIGGIEYWKKQGADGNNNFTLTTNGFLGIDGGTDRQNLSLAAADLDADGRADLVTGDQRGILSIYADFRSQNSNLTSASNILFNDLTKKYESRNLGGRIWPTIVNIFNTNKPSIVVGNTMGGIIILKNDEGKELPEQPEISIFPNPYPSANTNPLTIKSDRNIVVQIYNLLGQRLSDSYFIPANQDYHMKTELLPAGMYIARFSWSGKTLARRFVIQ
jgi:hypothetical protein